MRTDDMTQPLESVVRSERLTVRPLPLKAEDRRWLFRRWCELNPKTLGDIEQTALAIDARGMRVSTKYLVEKQRYEGLRKIVGVPFVDGNGVERVYAVNNTDRPMIGRWLLERHPGMNIEKRKSVYDVEGGGDGR